MKQLIKRLMFALAPQRATAIMSARARAHSHRTLKLWGAPEINDKLREHLGSFVQEGPFSGIRLSPMTYAEHLGPYLLGVYESELDEAWNTVFQGNYPQFIDVGAKFGYYAIGLARRYPLAKVIAFDTDWWSRKAIKEMAHCNAVENVEIRGFCSAEWLDANLAEGAFILSDCEGYEGQLFCGAAISRLPAATLIIETHDVLSSGVANRLRERLAETHSIREFGMEVGRRSSTRDLHFLNEQQRLLANQEGRIPTPWFLCLPRSGPNSALAHKKSMLA